MPRPLIALLAALLLPTAAASAADRIAYDADHFDGSGDVFTVDPDGTDLVRVTTDDAVEEDPTWSPDASRIAYVRTRGLWVMGADGSEQHRIVPNRLDVRDPAWSPDGRRIMFATDAHGEDLWTVRPSGRGLR